jgi:TPR repeat protein
MSRWGITAAAGVVLALAGLAAWHWGLIGTHGSKDQYKQGLRYINGDHVTQSYALAAPYFRRAATAGYAPAQYELGTLLRLGVGVPQDEEGGRLWIERAADQGYPPAVTLAGYLETTRKGGDSAKGLQWVEAAANFGDHWAEAQLALFYLNGNLEPADNNKALYWVERAHSADPADFEDLWRVTWQHIPASSRELSRALVSGQIGHEIKAPADLGK